MEYLKGFASKNQINFINAHTDDIEIPNQSERESEKEREWEMS